MQEASTETKERRKSFMIAEYFTEPRTRNTLDSRMELEHSAPSSFACPCVYWHA